MTSVFETPLTNLILENRRFYPATLTIKLFLPPSSFCPLLVAYGKVKERK